MRKNYFKYLTFKIILLKKLYQIGQFSNCFPTKIEMIGIL